MRVIKFRGKSVSTGQWVYGFYFEWRSKKDPPKFISYIHEIEYDQKGRKVVDIQHEVERETVGQFTGLNDKNSMEIYETDIYTRHGLRYEVRWLHDRFYLISREADPSYSGQDLFHGCKVGEVIGNIVDNPELVDGGK